MYEDELLTPAWMAQKAVESTTLEAIGSITRGSGWAPRGAVPRPVSVKPPRAARRSLRRCRRRTWALPRRAFDCVLAPEVLEPALNLVSGGSGWLREGRLV